MSKSHYTYLTGNIACGTFYTGVRSCDGPPEADTKYWGSSKELKRMMKLHPDGWEKVVLRTYPTRKEADDHEGVLVSKAVVGHPCFLNLARGGCNYPLGRKQSEHTKRLISASALKVQKTAQSRPEVRARNSAAQMAACQRPEVKAKRSAANASPEVRAKRSATAKVVFARPEVRAANAAAHAKPCTLDGITIYPSRAAIGLALGTGKNGYRSPLFRYV